MEALMALVAAGCLVGVPQVGVVSVAYARVTAGMLVWVSDYAEHQGHVHTMPFPGAVVSGCGLQVGDLYFAPATEWDIDYSAWAQSHSQYLHQIAMDMPAFEAFVAESLGNTDV